MEKRDDKIVERGRRELEGDMNEARRELKQEKWGGKRANTSEGWRKRGSSTSTAELSDLMCYQQELSGARA